MRAQVVCLALVVLVNTCKTIAFQYKNPKYNITMLQEAIDKKALEWNTTLSVAISMGPGSVLAACSGYSDRKGKVKCSVGDKYPVGSVTKPYTAVAIMQFKELGMIDIDAPIYTYVDPVLKRLNDTTMLELWKGDKTCLNITARHLMGMRGGLHDYNDTWYEYETLENPTFDISPFELLHRLNKTFVCPPGECGEYASTGFELLGLALVYLFNLKNWEDLDQMSIFPPHLRPEFNQTSFPGKGPCSKDPSIIHQYVMSNPPPWDSKHHKGPVPNLNETLNITIVDLDYGSCLNGWTCGNIAASASDIAHFHWSLHEGLLVNSESLAEMMTMVPMRYGWSPQLYGLATMNSWPFDGYAWAPDPHNLTFTVGHGGADYGSIGLLSGFNPRYQFGISLVTGSSEGMNCSMTSNLSAYGEYLFYVDTICPVYDAILQIVTGGTVARLNCSTCPACYPYPPPVPECEVALKALCGSFDNNEEACLHCAIHNATNRAKLLAAHCSSREVDSFCGYKPKYPVKSGQNVSCTWDL
eukprot:m.32957 g.32957  ORF g.32957 m.32957 type:complete len:527 (-) comp8472_c0_seq1:3912-5492(-)